jgi:hypothetical protein
MIFSTTTFTAVNPRNSGIFWMLPLALMTQHKALPFIVSILSLGQAVMALLIWSRRFFQKEEAWRVEKCLR